MKAHLAQTSEVLKHFETTENGLTTADAQSRIEKYGKNKLIEAKKETMLHRFLKQLADPMIIILLVAAAISAVVAFVEGEFPTDVCVIMFVVILNSVLGVLQESKAEKAIDALKEMTAATSKVLRDGKLEHVKSEDLVVGDIIILEAGDAVPADARLIECASIKAEEAALTGESVPVNKKVEALETSSDDEVPLGDRKNMVYMGSTIVYGRGAAVVVAIGMDTEMGKIADALAQAQEEKTPLQVKLGQLSKILTYLVIAICVAMFAYKVIVAMNTAEGVTLSTALNSFMLAISLAVAAIPEGLATVVTIVLSIGVTKMSKRNAVIRRLTAVETLGCTQIICSDKTGTLTQNKMTVTEHFGDDKELLATAMALCSDAELDDQNKATGEPTECALVDFAYNCGLHKNDLKAKSPRVGEAPFDSSRKMMSTVHSTGDGYVQYTKGAPDEILKNCTTYLSGGTVLPLTDDVRAQILKENKNKADKALRVLAAAYKKHTSLPESFAPEALENELTFVGLVGMIDPVRPEVKEAIEKCKLASIRPIMITGDHKDTAVAIAKELGIIEDASQAITGADLNKMSDEEFLANLEKYSVYARVQPEHKTRIVRAWKEKGMVTAMTGDGVNDAPSIKSSDIGIGMGITGTDVTKNVADMILADDNFATIVSAVEEGRKIYDNIRKAIQFLLSSNLSEVFSIFTATIVGFTILHPIHILWINLITDSLPALALGMEKGEKDIMERKPRNSKDGIFAGGLGIDLFYQGVLVTLLTIAAYCFGLHHELALHVDGYTISQFFNYLTSNASEFGAALEPVVELAKESGVTMAFLTMSMAEIFHSMNMRSQRGSIFRMKSHNFYLWGAMLLALILTTCVVEIPFLAGVFEFQHLSLVEYAVAMGLALSIIPIVEIVKFIQRSLAKKKNA
ncbi:MAG: cation-translocating P-type ATPase [Clostridia bacterium]|nr:cation-translocating P-type ATPase [Clostridia bacterium]